MEKKYIIKVSDTTNNGKEKGRELSKEIYRLMQPGDNSNYVMFNTIFNLSNTDEAALVIEPERIIKVSSNANFENLFSVIDENPNIPESVKNNILSKKNTDGTMIIDDLFPNNVKRYTYKELEDLGWFDNI